MKSLLCALSFLLICVAATAQSALPDTWVPNGRVYHMTQGDGRIFLSGDFNWFGEAYGNNAPILNTDLSLDSTFPKVTFPVEEAIPDDAGGWYTRGYGQIGHIKADKTIEILPITFNSSAVYTMAKSGNILYLAGGFTAVNGTTRNRIAAVDLTDNSVTPWDPNSNGTVYTVKVFGSTVYAGGSFSSIGGLTRSKIAAIDATTGTSSTWNANVTTAFGYVLDIVPTATAVYFGGNFSNVASAIPSRTNFAAVNVSTGALLTFNPRPSDIVYDLLLDGTTLYIAGKYTAIAGLSRYGLTSFDTGTGTITSFSADFSNTNSGPIRSMAVDGTKLFVGGEFLTVNNEEQPRLAVLDKATGAVLPTVDRKLSDGVLSICIVGTKVLVGSNYMRGITGDYNIRSMAALDEQTGQGTGWAPQVSIPNGWYIAEARLQFQDGRLYYWMNLEEPTDGLRQSLIGAMNPDDGSVDTEFSVVIEGNVTAWAFTPFTLYLAGDFTRINGSPRTDFAAVNLIDGHLLPFTVPSGFVSGADVRSMAVANNVLYFSGYFGFEDGGIVRDNLAAWDATNGEVLPWAPQVNLPPYTGVYVSAIHNGMVYLTGGVLLRVNAITGNTDNWTPDYYNDAISDGSWVNSLFIEGNYVYVAGSFSPGLTRVGISSGAATAWQPIIDDVYDSEGQVNAVSVSGGKLHVGGNYSFSRPDGFGQYFAQFDLPADIPNEPPQILSTASASPTEGIVSIDLVPLISDPDDNLDWSTLKLLNDVSYQGAGASVDASLSILTLDYGGPFTGTDSVYLEVCDLLEACTQQMLAIEIGSTELVIYNAVSPNGDGKNDLFILQNISPKNKVTILNRWGSVVFDIENYDNQTRVFRGLSNDGRELPPGVYYYRIDFPDTQTNQTGYLSLRR